MTDADIELLGHVLQEGGCRVVFDPRGDIDSSLGGGQGLYCHGVRCLSRLALTVEGATPRVVGASLKESHTLGVVESTSPDLRPAQGPPVAQGDLHLFRAVFLWEGACHGHVRISHHGREPVHVELALRLEADFAGADGDAPAQHLPPECLGAQLRLSARLPQGHFARTHIALLPAPGHLDPHVARWLVHLMPQGEFHLYFEVRGQVGGACLAGRAWDAPLDYESAYRANVQARAASREVRPVLQVADARLQGWLAASLADVDLLHPGEPAHEALDTARLLLGLDPAPAHCVLAQVAAVPLAQAGVREVPMFVALAGAYHRRTGDLQALRALWPRLREALAWIDDAMDARGFIACPDPDPQALGLHADGRAAPGPLALCEVQAHTYEARVQAADLARAMGDTALAGRLRAQARALRQRFHEFFWLEDAGCFAPALDARGQACRMVGVHAVHALAAGLATGAQASRVAVRLFEPDVFNGFGLRSLASGQPGFNALAAWRGAVWPRDNAHAALGLARYGHTDVALRLFQAMADAAGGFRMQRLPQRFAGATRREDEAPVRQPGSPWPDAGAAAAALGLLQACLGLQIDAMQRRVTLWAPSLPDAVPWLRLHGLRVGPVRLDLRVERAATSIGVQVTRQEGEGQVQVCTRALARRHGP